ncbi:MAG: aminopeptidase [Clostridium sp.]
MEFNFNRENYKFTIKKISKIAVKKYDNEPKAFMKFLQEKAKFISEMCNLEKNLDYKYFNKSFEELLEDNHKLYEEFTLENYEKSFCNPAYAVKVLGKELGEIATYLSGIYSKYRIYAFEHNEKMMHFYNEYFISIYNFVEDSRKEDAKEIKEFLKELDLENKYFLSKEEVKQKFVNVNSYIRKLVENEDLSDLRYLFKYGRYISDNEIKTAKFLNDYDNIDLIANTVCDAYIEGFKRDGKDYSIKSTARVIGTIGQERISRVLIEKLKAYSIEAIFDMIQGTPSNKQVDYDHRFDFALLYDEDVKECNLNAKKRVFEKYEKELKNYGGVLFFDSFGETPFSPKSKNEALKLNDEQNKIFQKYQSDMNVIIDKYIPNAETSFTMIAFPKPEIGDNFDEIFADILKINTLDNKKYEAFQKIIIDTLDKAEYVHVKGFARNKTDIMVKMYDIKNPNNETNFVNCVADVNIPVGEVYTTPELKGTNGLLHVEEVYLDDLKYKNLSLKFKDGYVEEYSCTNFKNEEENKKYIEENLLFPHKTLPMGEFAIGTNTLAYVIARKHNIVDLLPILIVEKMGPHFAIGDTCFSQCEDMKVYNPDGKEITARDNEKSILRKTDMENAYTNCHTDITLPYDDIEFISVITKNGETIEIIKDGRFVLEGTGELNKAFIV